MAAKPPKLPINLSKGNNKTNKNTSNNNNNNHNKCTTATSIVEALDNHISNFNNINKLNAYHLNEHNLLDEVDRTESPQAAVNECVNENLKLQSTDVTPTSCNCTNISIMHLFHEMKQEFPTIPDAIVTQCVNENCHQRENCIQMLKKELALHPIPVQTFPAKLLQQQQQQQRQKPPTPLKPIRVAPQQPPNVVNGAQSDGSAAAAAIVESQPVASNKCSSFNIYSNFKPAAYYCDSEYQQKQQQQQQADQKKNSKDVCYTKKTTNSCSAPNNNNNNNNINNNYNNSESDMPNTKTTTTTTKPNRSACEMYEQYAPATTPTTTKANARARPTTLNLHGGNHAQQQQQQRQLSLQLQQRLQQRQLQQQQQHVQEPLQQLTTSLPIQKPLRRAPLPPLPPKPAHTPQTSQLQQQHGAKNCIVSHTQQQQQQQAPAAHYNSHHNNNNNNNNQSSYSNDSTTSSCLTSPMSSSESELSVNVSLLSPATTATTTTTLAAAAEATATSSAAVSAAALASASTPTSHQQQPQQQEQQALKSPIRHRSVITLQPEPPYTRDYLALPLPSTPTNNPNSNSHPNSPSLASTPGSQKSYTSVNLTLRQPNLNSSLGPHSTIDISAGPAPNGSGAGLTYSSTSYDARRGCHKNLFITVNDEGGIFSASRIRSPHADFNGAHAPPYETSDGGSAAGAAEALTANVPIIANAVNPRNFMQRPIATQQQTMATAMPEIFPYPTETTNHIVPSKFNSNHLHSNSSSDESPTNQKTDICLQQELDASSEETLKLQKARRDKLATALRDNKKRLSHLGQQITILTEPVAHGESERLDRDIQKLRTDITQMMNELESGRRCDGSSYGQQQTQSAQQNFNNRTHSASHHQQQQQQHTPQPFPRQRSPRAQHATAALRQTSTTMSNATTSGTPMNPAMQQYAMPLQQQQTPNLDFIQHHSPSQPPPTYQEYYQQYSNTQQQPQTSHQQHQQLQQLHQHQHQLYQQQQQYLQQHHQQQMQQQLHNNADDEEYYSDTDSLANEEDDDESLEKWSCNMCTFRNHPQLNICEACENVRILPGMIRIVPSISNNNLNAVGSNSSMQHFMPTNRSNSNMSNGSAPSNNNVAVTAANLENDANLTQQQLQQFALHT